MSRLIATAVFASLLAALAMASQEGKYPLMEGIAQKVIQKYQTSSCEQLAADKNQPPNPKQAQMKAKAFEQLQRIARCEGVHRQGGRTDCQQYVRLRHDSLTQRRWTSTSTCSATGN